MAFAGQSAWGSSRRATEPSRLHAPGPDGLNRRRMNEPTSRGPHDHPVERIDRRNGSVIVRLVGELDLHTAPTVRETLLTLADEQPERLVVDLEEVEFIDSTALGVLIEARARLANHGAFRLAAPGLETNRALERSGPGRHLAVHETVGAALDAPLS